VKSQIASIADRVERLVIGLMSGTSADGVGAALLSLRGSGSGTSWELVAFETRPYSPGLRREILALQEDGSDRLLERIARLHFHLGDVYAESCASVAQKGGFTLDEVHLIGMHGQTVFHGTGRGGPDRARSLAGAPATLQLGEAGVVAERTGVSVVSNFRARDVAAGGTGAPLVPYVDYLLFRSEDESRLCLNVGGIANFTALPLGCVPENIMAFDTGPGNMVIDALVERYTEGRDTFDRSGDRAAQAPPHEGLLSELMAHDYFGKAPPKSAGREEFGRDFADRLAARAKELRMSPAAAISTATSLTARSVALAYRVHVMPRATMDAVMVSGGGAHNRTLMERLEKEMSPIPVRSTSYYGLDPDAKEAVAFAILANESIHGRPGNLPAVTGASKPVVLGSFTPGGTR
jgi:anhydro-N-acetylmuramic acid kinase